MQNIAYKFIVFTLTFFLVFNTASIAHAHTYETTNNVIKLDKQNSFFLKEELIKVIEQEKITFDVKEEMINQEMAGYFLTELTYIPLVLILFVLVSGLINLFNSFFYFSSILTFGLIILSIIAVVGYPALNSFYVYYWGKEKNKHSYTMPFWGSVVGYLVYMITISLLVILESNIILLTSTNENNDGFIRKNQDWFALLIMPLFTSAGATIFYQMSEEKSTPNETIKTSITSEELMNKIKNDFSFAEKIKVKNGAISLKIAGF